jgi:serine/threonine protein kinase
VLTFLDVPHARDRAIPAIFRRFIIAAANQPYEMSLVVGTRIGPYEITGTLGAGGMGEVYRARDARLARDVALKVLPDLFAADPERLARFQREAQVLAALKHPNIGAIYRLEQDVGIRALVLELVEGEMLADRIARGPIPGTGTVNR